MKSGHGRQQKKKRLKCMCMRKKKLRGKIATKSRIYWVNSKGSRP